MEDIQLYNQTQIGLLPTFQRYEGWPAGECVRASYATLLDMNINDVPRFDPASLNGEKQHDKEKRWLNSIGLDLIEISTAPDELPKDIIGQIPPIEHLISGISPRGFGHRCVGFGGRVLFDPHPSKLGLRTIYSVGFLVPRG